MSAHDPQSAERPPEPPEDSVETPAPSRLRRVVKWTGRIVGGLIGFVLLLVGLLLYSPLGAVAVDVGLDVYDDMIAGTVHREAVQGTLASGLTIRELALNNAEGEPLVTVERFDLRLSPARLLTRQAIVDLLAVEQVHIDVPYVGPEVPGGPFADLIPPPGPPEPPPEPEPPAEGIGPDLPLRIRALVDVHGVTLRQQSPDGTWQTAVDDAHLVIRAEAQGRTARVELDPQTRVGLPTVPVQVAGAGLLAEWDEPLLTISKLRVATDVGDVAAPQLTLDARTLALDGGLVVEGRAAPLVARFGLPIDRDPRVTLLADGAAGRLKVGLLVEPGQGSPDGGLWMRIDAEGTAQPLDLKAEVLVEGVDVARQAEGLPVGRLGLVVRATVAGASLDDLDIDAAVDCLGCEVDGVGPIDLSVFGRLVDGTGSAALRLEGAGLTVDGRAEVWELADLRAHLDVAMPDVPETLAAARAFAPDIPPLKGAVDLEADCTGPLTGPTCTTRLAVRDFAGQGVRLKAADVIAAVTVADGPRFSADIGARQLAVNQDRFRRLDAQVSGDPRAMLLTLDGTPATGEDLKLAAAVTVGPPLDVKLLALDGRARGIRLDLANTAGVTVEPSGRVRVDGLSLGVGRGSIEASGTFDPKGHSDLRLDIDRLDLADLNGFVPGLGLRGRVQVGGHIRGRADDPDLDLDARIAGLAFRGAKLGSARARVGFDGGRLDADVDLSGGLAKRLVIDAKVPFDLDLESGKVGPRFEGRQSIDIAVDDLRLERLEPLLGKETPLPTGRIDVEGRFTGARTPEGGLKVTLTDFQVMQWTVDRLTLAAAYDGRSATADLDVDSPYAETITFDAGAPVRIDLQAGRFDWRQRGDHDVKLAVDGVDFAAIAERVPALEDVHLLLPPSAGGQTPPPARLALNLTVKGPAVRPEVSLEVEASRLGDPKIPITGVKTAVELDDEGVAVVIGVDSPAVSQIALTAAVPLALRPLAAEPVQWKPAEDHALTVVVDNADLAGLVPPGGPAVAGRADVRIQLAGNAREPRLDGRIDSRGLVVDGRQLGRIELGLGSTRERATADLKWVHDSDTLLGMQAAVPIDIDVEGQSFVWKRASDHRLDLRFSGIDRDLLTQFVPLGEQTEPSMTLTMSAKGHLDAFEIDLDLDGGVKLPTGYRAPVQGRIRLRPDRQTVRIASPLDGEDLDIDLTIEAPVPALVSGEADPNTIAYDAKIRVPGLNLEPLGPLLPISLYGPRGALFVDLAGAGTVGAPELKGQIGLRDGAITLVDLSQRVEDVQLAVNASTRGIELETLRARSGNGRLSGSGAIELGPHGPQGEITLGMNRWPLVRPGVPRALIDTRVVTALSARPEQLSVEVGVHDTQVRLVGQNVSAPKSIPSNPQVVFDQPPPPPEMMPPGPDDAPSGEEEAPPAPAQRVAVEVVLKDPVEIRGSGVVMSWVGRIVAITGPATEVQGALNSTEGSFTLLGNEFQLDQGRVYLPDGGGLPYLDIIAGTTVDTYRINASIRGKVDRPILEFTSDPPLPDYQILTVLVTGAPESGGEGDGDGSVAREAASLLAAFQNAAIEDALNERLGIDRVSLDFGDTVDQPILTVGKRINPDLYVETVYHQNAPDDANSIEARARFRITPAWSFETAAGDKGIGTAELTWVRHFGGHAAARSLDAISKDAAEDAEDSADAEGGGGPADAQADGEATTEAPPDDD